MSFRHRVVLLTSLALGAAALSAPRAAAHCDGLDGPVVAAAREALAAGKPDAVLIWVRPADEKEIAAAFEEAAKVRRLGPDARALADRSFFETVVRVHRAGEGAPFTGLKPAGRDPGPAIAGADAALKSGSPDALAALLAGEAERGLRERFARAMKAKAFRPGDAAAGREYVRAYVEFIHYAERLHQAAAGAAGEGGHAEDD